MWHTRTGKTSGVPNSRNGRVRAVVAWIFLLLFVVVGTAIWIVDNSAPNWQSFDLPNGGCRVKLPGRPKLEKLPGSSVVYSTSIREQDFSIGFLDLDPASNAWDVITKYATGFAHALPGMVEISRRNITLDGRDGLEVSAADSSGESVVARFVVVEGRLFTISAFGDGINATRPDVVTFFDSFKVTNPDPLGRAAERGATPTVELSNRELKAMRDELEMLRVDGEFNKWFQNVERLAQALPLLDAYPEVRLLFSFSIHDVREIAVKDSVSGKLFGNLQKPVRPGFGASGVGLAFPVARHEFDVQDLDAFRVLNGKPFTITLWFCAREMTGNLFTAFPSNTSATKKNIRLALYANHAKLDWPSGDSIDVPVPSDGQWHHFALSRTLSDSLERIELYIDGVDVGQTEIGPQADLSDLNGLKFGGGQFVGGVDEFAIFQRALSKEEIRKIAGVSSDRSSKDPKWLYENALHLPMDVTRNGRLIDGSTGSPVGAIRGRTEGTDGIRGTATRFQGGENGESESLIDLSEIVDRLTGNDSLACSISFWIRPSGSATMLKNDEFELTVSSGVEATKAQVRLAVLSPSSDHPGLTAPFSPENDWSHVVLTRDVTGSVRLFVNGKKVDSDLGLTITTNTNSLFKELLWCDSPCDVDEVAVYRRELEAGEVLLLFGPQ
ncbi:MAG: hypothetical protein JNL67_20455 [Planctomycetaceae bacterium]|nr:hypothetical protein [Planctomycetaceae bacterium]